MKQLSIVFKNSSGHFRAGWRILFYFILFVTLSELNEFLYKSFLLINGDTLSDYTLLYNRFTDKTLKLLSVLLPALILLKFVDKRPIGLLGLSLYKGVVKELSIGMAIGFFLGIVSVLITYFVGLGSFNLNNISIELIIYVLAVLIILIISAVYEEILFRGYIFQSSIEGTNFFITLFIISLLFGASHLDNEGINIYTILFTISAGVLLGIMYYRIRALWMCIGTHFVWNWLIGPVFGMELEQSPFIHNSIFTFESSQSVLIGSANSTGDIIQTAIFIALSIIIWRSKLFKPSDYNIMLWKNYPSHFENKVKT